MSYPQMAQMNADGIPETNGYYSYLAVACSVISAKAGIQSGAGEHANTSWIPAFAAKVGGLRE